MTNKYGLDLDAAWKAVLADFGSDNIPDVLRLQDYKLAWPTLRNQLETELDSDNYRPSPARIVEVPKSELMIRPIALLRPRDRVVYHAVVAKLAPLIEASLSAAVHSARYDIHRGKVIDQRSSWIRMQQEGRRLHVEEHYGFMLSTDVVSYFEYVNLETLMRDFRSLKDVDEESLGVLSRFLNELERSSDVWGLPQGPEVSSILGNFYLQPVDRELELHPVVALRFQDDIKVFANDAATLRRVLRDVTRVMRGRRLSVSVQKTKIFEGDEILVELEDARKDAIAYGIKAGGLPSVIEDVRGLFDDAVAEDPVNARDVRFSVYRLSQAEDPHAIPWILNNLARVPFLAPLLVDYLSAHLESDPDIELRARDYLRDPGGLPHVRLTPDV